MRLTGKFQMKLTAIIFLFLCACQHPDQKVPKTIHHPTDDTVVDSRSYEEIKAGISLKRKNYLKKYATKESLADSHAMAELTDYWVTEISTTLFDKWKDTPWDFNGTTTEPKQGEIACGYFVTTILQAMDLSINRQKLSTCASSEMMKSLVPDQKLKVLNYLSYPAFNDSLTHLGKGVYIIGLDFHTGFIVNDGDENWFIHSNYIQRKGVTKETVMNSDALKVSKTRWMVSLTGDKEFLYKWLTHD
ncbi:MAG: hypothetical protein ABI480_09020 [Chitinophagaceae bacterium]